MKLPLQVSFRQMEPAADIEELVRKKAACLDHFSPHIMSCRVVVEFAGQHHLHGNQYEVHIDLTRSAQCRRIPVVDDDGKLVGLVNLDDILELLTEEFQAIGGLLRDESPRSLSSV